MRNLNRDRRVRLNVPTMLVAASFLTVSMASAQTVLEVVPSVAIGSVYDNNLFAKVEGSAPAKVLGIIFNRDERPMFGYYDAYYKQYFPDSSQVPSQA